MAVTASGISVSLVVNGKSHRLRVNPSRSLLDVLRDNLDLTGAKKACDAGECGSCMVLLGDKGVMACLLPVSRAKGKEITTIEGLPSRYFKELKKLPVRPDALHPLQEAFVEYGASQCGFCIPGIIIEASALLKVNPRPTRQEVVKRLSRNLCRCTGYVKIVDAILHASAVMKNGQERHTPAHQNGHYFGQSVVSLDALDEVTGKAKYAADLKKEGMIYAKLLRSPHYHARILSIDTSEAEAMPGVEAVVTAKDIQGPSVMLNCRPQPDIFVKDTVRFVGEAIAVVAAASEDIASEAVKRIKVEYEQLPPVLNPLEAMKDSSAKLYPPFNNWILAEDIQTGDVDRAFAQADAVVENTYTTQPWEHSAMEPEAALAYLDESGRITVHSPQHHPFVGRDWVAELLKLPYDKVRFICPAMGGNFGMRGDFLHSGTAALLAHKTGKPVKIVLTREESILGSSKSHSFVLRYKTGADKNGKLVALEAELIGNGGCWIPQPEVTSKKSTIARIGELVPGPYNVPNVRIKVYEVCTNRPRSIPMRGTNMPQMTFAWESQMEMLAGKLGIDPYEFRVRNIVDIGDRMVTGALLDESVGARPTFEALRKPYAEALARKKSEPLPGAWKRGIGLTCLWQVNGGGRGEDAGGGWHGRKLGPARAGMELLPDGRIRVMVGAVEKGQGVITGIAQIAAEQMQIPLESLDMVYGDTLLAPYPVGTSGQRTSMHVGGAAFRAAETLKLALTNAAAKHLEEQPENIVYKNGILYSSRAPEEKLSLSKMAQYMKGQGMPLKYEGTFVLEKTAQAQGPVYGYASQLMELDVNTETGQIKVHNVVYAADVGRVINPQNFEGQVEGGVVMGMSYGMREHFVPGKTKTLKEYGIPTTKDAPDHIKTIVVENPVQGGPFGSKGGAEMPVSPSAATVANAIADATGARVFDLPMTPERVRKAMGKP